MTDEEKDYINLSKKVIDYVKTMYCPDQYVGIIKPKENWRNFGKRTDIFQKRTSKTQIKIAEDKIFLLILESPHTDEFDKNNEAIGPANGTTGRHIRKYICDIFGNEYQGYHLVLINAIPFQCSLGVGTKHFRDDVFKKIWNEDGKVFFVDRLTKLFKSKPDNFVIANCCTKGYSEESPLYQYVSEAIDITGLKYIQLDHPAIIWNTKKARERLREKVKSAGLYKEKASEK